MLYFDVYISVKNALCPPGIALFYELWIFGRTFLVLPFYNCLFGSGDFNKAGLGDLA
tara:strand:- start:522 stop:692 length:171 start_codon:yes stop_codon:yes gene_type:complete